MVRNLFTVFAFAAACVLSQASALAAPGKCSDPQRCKIPLNECRVVIDRTQIADVFDVTRQMADDGQCVCYAYTGPATQRQSTESKIADLVARKQCPDARLMAVTGPAAGAVAGGSGFLAGPLAPLLGIGALGGGVAAASSSSADPVSP